MCGLAGVALICVDQEAFLTVFGNFAVTKTVIEDIFVEIRGDLYFGENFPLLERKSPGMIRGHYVNLSCSHSAFRICADSDRRLCLSNRCRNDRTCIWRSSAAFV